MFTQTFLSMLLHPSHEEMWKREAMLCDHRAVKRGWNVDLPAQFSFQWISQCCLNGNPHSDNIIDRLLHNLGTQTSNSLPDIHITFYVFLKFFNHLLKFSCTCVIICILILYRKSWNGSKSNDTFGNNYIQPPPHTHTQSKRKWHGKHLRWTQSKLLAITSPKWNTFL